MGKGSPYETRERRQRNFSIPSLRFPYFSPTLIKSSLFSAFEFPVPVESVVGVVGFPAELPCDVTPTAANDQLLLILWYKEGHSSPIYT